MANTPSPGSNAPTPSGLKLKREERLLEVRYADGSVFALPCEYLRVFSPSAEVRGHGLEEPVLVPGKQGVNISAIEPVGRYAVRLRFDDGHDTGLYTWEVFHDLGTRHAEHWARYLTRLAEHGMSRERDLVKLSALPKKYTPPSTV